MPSLAPYARLPRTLGASGVLAQLWRADRGRSAAVSLLPLLALATATRLSASVAGPSLTLAAGVRERAVPSALRHLSRSGPATHAEQPPGRYQLARALGWPHAGRGNAGAVFPAHLVTEGVWPGLPATHRCVLLALLLRSRTWYGSHHFDFDPDLVDDLHKMAAVDVGGNPERDPELDFEDLVEEGEHAYVRRMGDIDVSTLSRDTGVAESAARAAVNDLSEYHGGTLLQVLDEDATSWLYHLSEEGWWRGDPEPV